MSPYLALQLKRHLEAARRFYLVQLTALPIVEGMTPEALDRLRTTISASIKDVDNTLVLLARITPNLDPPQPASHTPG